MLNLRIHLSERTETKKQTLGIAASNIFAPPLSAICLFFCLHYPSPRGPGFCSIAMGISETFPRSLRCIVVVSLLWVADHGVSWVSPQQVSVASRTVSVTRQAVMSPPPALKPPKEEPKVNPKRAEWLETWILFDI